MPRQATLAPLRSTYLLSLLLKSPRLVSHAFYYFPLPLFSYLRASVFWMEDTTYSISGRRRPLQLMSARSILLGILHHPLDRCRSNTTRIAGGIWLKSWSDKNTQAGGNPQVGKYLGIYFVFGVGAAGLTVLQTLVLWIFCSIEVSLSKLETVEGILTRGPIRHLGSCMREWQQQSSGHRCPFSMSHQPAEF